MNKIIIFDFEVFKHDTLLGAIIIDNDNIQLFQSWSLEQIKELYYKNTTSIWIGHNNENYDNHILQRIVAGCSSEEIKNFSDKLINTERKIWLKLPLYYYDLICNHFGSLKAVECAAGKNISTTEVDFNIDRALTSNEKILTENYNYDDLDQTLDDLLSIKGELLLRLDVIEEFKLNLNCLNITGTQLAETVLSAKKIKGIENWTVKPQLYDNLQIKNKDVINFYLNEEFRAGKQLTINIAGVEHKLGAGGLHGAKAKCHVDWAFYFDVSGYYNLIMILLDLLPRSIGPEGKKLYKHMYEQQLILKKTDPSKRWVYKVILLSVFGAMTNPYCKFYDPNNGTLVTMVGQMYLIDLLEKIDGKVQLIQSNTDGIFAKPLPGVSEEDLVAIINEWQERTGFVLKLEKVYNIHQRDVNNYCYQKENGKVYALGEAVKYYNAWENPLEEDVFKAKEPPIIHHAIVDFFMYNKLPEQTIEENKRKLRMFQYCCKKVSYQWMEYEETNVLTSECTTIKVPNVCRVFAFKSDKLQGMLYKRKSSGKTTKAKVSNLSDNVFVYNKEILSDKSVDELIPKIDYNYYIKRSYERILEFIDIPEVKDVKIK